LHQVEYAIEAINNAGTCVGLVASDGIILGGELKAYSSLLTRNSVKEKSFKIDDHIFCIVAGLTADATVLLNQARRFAFSYSRRYQEPVPVEVLVRRVCDFKQAYTQSGGLRPFGVSFLFGGHDSQRGFQLYFTDPSGNYTGWKGTVIGQNNQPGRSLLKEEYEPETATLDSCTKLAMKVLLKTMDTTAPSAEKFEFSVLRFNEHNELVQQSLEESKVSTLISELQAEAEAEEGKENQQAREQAGMEEEG
jgi:20S proteasome subunit alpha 3